ncbi:MAG: hypothetical protein ACTHOF_14765 [Flavisolibacter sp.]
MKIKPIPEVFEFAQKLTGAWETTNKSMIWFFEPPDETTYPDWVFQIKHEGLDEFMQFTYLLYNPVRNIFRIQYNAVGGLNEYLLKFWDDNTLEVSKLLNGKVIAEILHRVSDEDVESLFE